jgi:hypothetical protein
MHWLGTIMWFLMAFFAILQLASGSSLAPLNYQYPHTADTQAKCPWLSTIENRVSPIGYNAFRNTCGLKQHEKPEYLLFCIAECTCMSHGGDFVRKKNDQCVPVTESDLNLWSCTNNNVTHPAPLNDGMIDTLLINKYWKEYFAQVPQERMCNNMVIMTINDDEDDRQIAWLSMNKRLCFKVHLLINVPVKYPAMFTDFSNDFVYTEGQLYNQENIIDLLLGWNCELQKSLVLVVHEKDKRFYFSMLKFFEYITRMRKGELAMYDELKDHYDIICGANSAHSDTTLCKVAGKAVIQQCSSTQKNAKEFLMNKTCTQYVDSAFNPNEVERLILMYLCSLTTNSSIIHTARELFKKCDAWNKESQAQNGYANAVHTLFVGLVFDAPTCVAATILGGITTLFGLISDYFLWILFAIFCVISAGLVFCMLYSYLPGITILPSMRSCLATFVHVLCAFLADLFQKVKTFNIARPSPNAGVVPAENPANKGHSARRSPNSGVVPTENPANKGHSARPSPNSGVVPTENPANKGHSSKRSNLRELLKQKEEADQITKTNNPNQCAIHANPFFDLA